MLIQDINLVKGVRSEGIHVWIKLATVNLASDIIIRISSKVQDLYRPWFNVSVDLASKGFWGNDVWSNRFQTEARFILMWVIFWGTLLV